MEEIKTRTPTRIGWNTYLVFINYHSTHSLPRRYPFLMLFKPQFITLGHDVKNDNANAPSTRKAGRSDRSRSTDSFVLKSILCVTTFGKSMTLIEWSGSMEVYPVMDHVIWVRTQPQVQRREGGLCVTEGAIFDPGSRRLP